MKRKKLPMGITEMISISDNTPLLRFLLWSSRPDVNEVDIEVARDLYFVHEDYARLVEPTPFEQQLISRLLYGIQTPTA